MSGQCQAKVQRREALSGLEGGVLAAEDSSLDNVLPRAGRRPMGSGSETRGAHRLLTASPPAHRLIASRLLAFRLLAFRLIASRLSPLASFANVNGRSLAASPVRTTHGSRTQ